MQTAKTGQLIVRQNDFTVDRNVSILVNMEFAPLPQLERCMELLRSVCEELEEQRIPSTRCIPTATSSRSTKDSAAIMSFSSSAGSACPGSAPFTASAC